MSDVPVLVVGGGGSGLAASLFLSRAGVPHQVVERRAGTSDLPRAHYLNQRTMELFRQHGVADDVYRVSCPLPNMSEVVWRTTLAGDGPLDARDLHRMDAFGGFSTAGPYAADSPCPATNLPQHRLEPVLLRHVRDRVAFHQELTGLTQDADGVTAEVTDRGTGDVRTVRARYLIAADGGRFVTGALGVPVDRVGGDFSTLSVHFAADLSRWWPGDSVLMTHLLSPDGEIGIVIAAGPHWGSRCEEWALHSRMPLGAGADLDPAAVADRVRTLLNLPAGTAVTVRRVTEYRPEAVVAQSFRAGRVFLIGDAAHRQPPAAGGGLNTAVQDAHNLAWKLAAVLAGRAGPALLDSYQTERRPVARRNVDWSTACLRNYGTLFTALGLVPGRPEATAANLAALLAGTATGETRRAVVSEVFGTQRIEYQAHDIELGAHYAEGALVPDGTRPPPRDPMGAEHHPRTRPGHRLPHAWVDGVSTLDLVGPDGGFALLTGPLGDAWGPAAKTVADRYRLPLAVVPLDPAASASWAAVAGIDDGGALLVRPDNHVAWRAPTAVAAPDAVLDDVFRRVLHG